MSSSSRMITASLDIHSNGIHVQQIYTGFSLLKKSGYLILAENYNSERIRKNKKLGFKSSFSRCVNVKIGDVKICYDMNDNPYFTQEFLESSDFYFKRSYAKEIVENQGVLSSRIHPYGFNYLVYPDSFDWSGLKRNFRVSNLRTAIKNFPTYLPVFDGLNFVPRVSIMNQSPQGNQEPKVLFIARLWDPNDSPTRQDAEIKERTQINEIRIQCILELKRNFGNRFLGGLIDSGLSQKLCPELVISDSKITSQRGFLNLMKQHPVCISTMGLHKSNGYKLAEYIAFARAIVSEPLHYQVTGNFQKGKNYLEFNSVAECVECVDRLFTDQALRNDIMYNNWEYFRKFERPDAIVRHTIELALGQELKRDFN